SQEVRGASQPSAPIATAMRDMAARQRRLSRLAGHVLPAHPAALSAVRRLLQEENNLADALAGIHRLRVGAQNQLADPCVVQGTCSIDIPKLLNLTAAYVDHAVASFSALTSAEQVAIPVLQAAGFSRAAVTLDFEGYRHYLRVTGEMLHPAPKS